MTTVQGSLNVISHPNDTSTYGTGDLTIDGDIIINGGGTAGQYITISSQQLSDVLLTLPITDNLSDTILGRRSSDTLLHKIITDSTNTVYAKGLTNATTDVVISASAAPSANQALIASNSTTAAWATIDHTNLSNIGTNSHSDIDVHIASTANPHSVDIDDVTPTTTKGDIIVENGSNAVRLAVGSSGQVLTVDSTTGTGLKWADPSGGGVTFVDWTAWTPSDIVNITTLTNTESKYTRLGNKVTLQFDMTITPTATSDSIVVGGLPINIANFTNGTKLSSVLYVRSVSDSSVSFGEISMDAASDDVMELFASNWIASEPYYVRGQIDYGVAT